MSEQLPKSYKAAVCKEGKKPFEIVDRDLQMPKDGQVRRSKPVSIAAAPS